MCNEICVKKRFCCFFHLRRVSFLIYWFSVGRARKRFCCEICAPSSRYSFGFGFIEKSSTSGAARCTSNHARSFYDGNGEKCVISAWWSFCRLRLRVQDMLITSGGINRKYRLRKLQIALWAFCAISVVCALSGKRTNSKHFACWWIIHAGRE